VIVLVSAFVVLALSWWLTRRLSSPQSVLRLLDEPNERSLHSVPTPRTGGLAMVVSLVAGFGVAAGLAVADPAVLGPARPTWRTLWVVAAIALVCVVSFLDDRITLPVSRRFALQGVAVLMLVYGGDLAVSAVPIPAIGTLPLAWLSGPVSLLFLLWMANLYNFMDGMDGFAGGMTVILCVGETLEQRDAGKTLDVITGQVRAGLEGVSLPSADRMILAYEPVWAIGTGRVATREQAQEAHLEIRACLGSIGLPAAEIAILYGGSVKPDNIDGLMAEQAVIRVPGSGLVRGGGTVDQLVVDVSGSGAAQLEGLEARDVTATLSGSGVIRVTATRRLDARVSGTGTVLYGGSPETVTREVTGTGAIVGQ